MMGRRIHGRAGEIQPEPEITETETTEDDPAETAPADLTEAAAQFERDETELRERAEQARAEAKRRKDAAQAEAQKLIDTAAEEAAEITATAGDADHQADKVKQRRLLVADAARRRASAEKAEQQVGVLTAEREDLTAAIAKADGEIERLRADRQAAEAQLVQAREAVDGAAVQHAQGRISADDDLLADQERIRAKASDRMRALGDGTEHFPGELSTAMRAAASHRAAERRLVNEAWPDTYDARLQHALDELRNAAEGNLARITEEASAKPESRQIVHL